MGFIDFHFLVILSFWDFWKWMSLKRLYTKRQSASEIYQQSISKTRTGRKNQIMESFKKGPKISFLIFDLSRPTLLKPYDFQWFGNFRAEREARWGPQIRSVEAGPIADGKSRKQTVFPAIPHRRIV